MCREQLPVWQKFYEKHHHENFEIFSISMDTQGADVARRFTEAAGVTFPSAVDRAQGLWDLYGFPVVPNGFFVDEQGILRYVKIGEFDARNPADAAAIERLLSVPSRQQAVLPASDYARPQEEALQQAEEAAKGDPTNLDLRLTLAERLVENKQDDRARREFQSVLEVDPKSTRALVGLATAYLDMGQKQKALTALQQAAALDPNNWIIHKQIWAIEHPEQFYPAINPEWQRERLKEEGNK
ncbi:MAG: tetratricopeptide repeat protein [Terriglobia bacterium]